MANGTPAPNGISSATLSKLAMFIIPLVLAAFTAWTAAQIAMHDEKTRGDNHEKRLTALEQQQEESKAATIEQLKKQNEKLQALLDAQKQNGRTR